MPNLKIEEKHTGATTWWMVDGKNCEISIEQRPYYCDRGNWLAKLHIKPGTTPMQLNIDGHDGWPRYYFDYDRMLAEIEAWLVKRGQLPEELESLEPDLEAVAERV